MSDTFNELKSELVTDIKKLATDLSEADSFIGLIAQQSKFQSLNEKFTVLKFLHHKRLGNKIFEELETVHELEKEVEKLEQNIKEEPLNTTAQEIKEKEPKDEVQTEKVIPKLTKKEHNETQTSSEKLPKEKEHKAGKEKLHSIQILVEPICLDLNDEMGFSQYLFGGDYGEFSEMIKALNSIQNQESSLRYLNAITIDKKWNAADEYVQRLKEMIINRFL